MKRISILLALTAALTVVGCKKKKAEDTAGSGSAPAVVATSGATCAEAINHSMELSKDDMAKMPGFDAKMIDKMRELGTKRCDEDKWSGDALKCMVDAKTMADSQGCYGKLTPEQQEKMNKAAMELATPPAGSDTAGSAAGSAEPAGSGSAAAGSAAPAGSGSAAAGSAAAGSAGSN